MFNLFKKNREPRPLEKFNAEEFAKNNPVVIWCDNDINNKISLHLNTKSNRYETLFLIPVISENGIDEVKFNHMENMASYSIGVLFAYLDNNIYTIQEFKEKELNFTKINELKELIKRLEKL